jgi:hypothetical protein
VCCTAFTGGQRGHWALQDATPLIKMSRKLLMLQMPQMLMTKLLLHSCHTALTSCCADI